ncbi:MAG: hypothetical protein HY290_16055 [Planctomycetia bacterium]|nr:hypothetical protein [Planctomycetia bacterium]
MRNAGRRFLPDLATTGRPALLFLAALLLAGCGADLYEERLANTRSMFAHQDQLNQNLQAAWGDGETRIGLRPPTQFVMLPPPAKPAPDPAAGKGQPGDKKAGEETEAEEEVEVIDDRQPAYMNIALPGLRGAFRAPLIYSADNNATREGEGFLYVLSNHHLAEQPDKAKEFERDFIKELSEALHLTVEAGDWRDERFPLEAKAKAAFVKSLPYRNVILTSSEDISGYVREFAAYMYEQGDVQVIVLFVLPKDVETAAKLNDRIPLCLETLQVSGDKLMLPSAGAPAGVTGSSSGSF